MEFTLKDQEKLEGLEAILHEQKDVKYLASGLGPIGSHFFGKNIDKEEIKEQIVELRIKKRMAKEGLDVVNDFAEYTKIKQEELEKSDKQ